MKTALVVDNSKVIRRVCAEMLKMLGFAVEGAEDAEAALALCRAAPPDIVLVDLDLPGGGGADLAARLRSEPNGGGIKIVLLSIEEDARDGTKVFNPFNMDGLTCHLTELGVLQPAGPETPPYVMSEFSILAMGRMDIANVDIVRIAAGEMLFNQGDVADCAWILISGAVDFIIRQGAVTRHLATAKPFQMFGESASLNFEPRLASAIAAEECELIRIPRASLLKRLDSMDPFARSWIVSLTRQVSGLLRLSSERRRGGRS